MRRGEVGTGARRYAMREVKKRLRAEMINRRRIMDKEYKNSADIEIFKRLIPLINEADMVFTYVSTEIEVDTKRALEYCFLKKIPAAVPKTRENSMEFFRIGSFSELRTGRFGIQEPFNCERAETGTKRSLCIVPALCADGKGGRLGYGGGYYDRFLTGFAGKSVIICYGDFCREIPIEAHDRKADLTIFEISCGGSNERKPF